MTPEQKPEEPYKSKMYYALKGDEFEAKAKTNSKTDQELVARRRATILCKAKGQARVSSWLPKADTLSGPQTPAFYTIPSPKPATFTISKADRSNVLVNPITPNENRFLFNPRNSEHDPYKLTHSMHDLLVIWLVRSVRSTSTTPCRAIARRFKRRSR